MSASLPASNIRDQMRHVLASPGPSSVRSLRRVVPPVVAGMTADALLEPWFSCLRDRLGSTRLFDCHTHLGCADPDGSCFGVDELLGALAAVDGRAVVFPLAEPDGYRAANDRMLAAAQAAEGRLVAFVPRRSPRRRRGARGRARPRSRRGGDQAASARRAVRAGGPGGPPDPRRGRRAPAAGHRSRRPGHPLARTGRARARARLPAGPADPRARRDRRPVPGSGARPRGSATCSSTPPGGTPPISSHCSRWSRPARSCSPQTRPTGAPSRRRRWCCAPRWPSG